MHVFLVRNGVMKLFFKTGSYEKISDVPPHANTRQ
jgi:hypothetical protein